MTTDKNSKGMKIFCMIFQRSGAWYTDELVIIPNDTPEYKIPTAIKNHAKIRNMYYLYFSRDRVPKLVNVGE